MMLARLVHIAHPAPAGQRGPEERPSGGSRAGSDTLFDEPGINLGRDLKWIQRDQYVYYLEMAHHLGDPDDWADFRSDLAEALSAAFSLERTPPWADRRSTEDMKTRQRVLDVLDSIRFRHHPATDWDGFFDALWQRRSELRPDL